MSANGILIRGSVFGDIAFDQTDALARVFTQAAGKATAGGATANDDVMEFYQAAVQPPSILRLWPVTIAEASDARYRAATATSFGCPTLPKGIIL